MRTVFFCVDTQTVSPKSFLTTCLLAELDRCLDICLHYYKSCAAQGEAPQMSALGAMATNHDAYIQSLILTGKDQPQQCLRSQGVVAGGSDIQDHPWLHEILSNKRKRTF